MRHSVLIGALLAHLCSLQHLHRKCNVAITTEPVVFILDGKSEIGAYVRSNPCYLICLRHLIRSKTFINHIFFHGALEPLLFDFRVRIHHLLGGQKNGKRCFGVLREGLCVTCPCGQVFSSLKYNY